MLKENERKCLIFLDYSKICLIFVFNFKFFEYFFKNLVEEIIHNISELQD
jgi:hypothetical protein